ncbi:MAG: thioredoxin domain-containing protein [Desulfobacteraceae bacterium]|jgi:thioredoxin 2|nr:thioredoxin domain-containing protein [Desulfobacteraceae bacterium]
MTSTDAYILRCDACGTRNRIPAARIGAPARCGRCGKQIDTRVLADGRPRMVGDANFEAEVIHSPLPTLVFFWAPWCPTCLKTAPIIDRLAGEARGRLRVAKINVDKAQRVSDRYDIRAVPYIYVFDNGQAVANMPGGMDEAQLKYQLARFL